MTHTLPLAVVFRSAWGVSTGTGIAGGVDSIVEKDAAGRPVVRGTVLTGVIRERAVTAAQALDDGATDGPWSRFARDLFGPGPDDDGQDDQEADGRARHWPRSARKVSSRVRWRSNISFFSCGSAWS